METREYKGYTIEIWQDENPENPRDWNNLGKMVCFHRRYNLGDKHDFSSPDDFREFVKSEKPPVVLPLYLYDHSVLSISTRSFVGRAQHADWDSGQVGWIYVTAADIREEMARPKGKPGKKNPDLKRITRITAKDRERAQKILESEVETYDQYLRGEVYGFTIKDVDEETIDSCGGFFGDPDGYLMEEVRSIIDNREKHVGPYSGPETYEDIGW